MREVSAVVVARGGSVRVPRKSMLYLDGETLIERKIRQLKECKRIDRVIFGSDDEDMLTHAFKMGVEVYKRPAFFCNEECATANEMICNMLTFFKTDIVVWAHCTNPLISSKTYDLAVEEFCQAYDKGQIDSLLSVVELREHLWNITQSHRGGGTITG